MHKLVETRALCVYKKLLQVLGEYDKRFPATGVGQLLDAALFGSKVCPGDKLALNILDVVLSNSSPAAAVNDLQNKRFSDLPVCCRPIYRAKSRHQVAFWKRGDIIADRVRGLIDFDGSGSAGYWCDQDGNKVTLIDMAKETGNE